MSASALPDEIVFEILHPASEVDDTAFSDTSPVSPFANSLESTAAHLLVCKSWMRVGTPLLYSVVVLRSEAQAEALARTLLGKDLGRVVKKLRVEGGFGLSMHVILQCTPNVTDLFLSLNIYPRDSAEGLCRGLRLISPIRLIVQDLDTRDNSGNVRSTKLAEAVAKAIPKWIRLSVFEFPFDEGGFGPYITVLIHPLAKEKRLHTVVVARSAAVYTVYAMLGECPLQNIHIKRPVSRRDLPISHNPALASILSYTERPDAESCGKLSSFGLNHAFKANPSFVPLSSVSQEAQDKVWSRVLYFAMHVPERAKDHSRNDLPRRLLLLLVSKTFHRLGLPHYYVHVVLTGPLVSIPFTSALSHIQTIHSRSRILWRDFETLVKLSKTSLRECCIRVDAPRKASPDIFSDLAELQTLDWHSTASFANIPTETPVDAMPKLRNLRIRDSDQSFLAALSLMKLTSLRRFVITWNLDCNQFLRVHGTHLSEIEIALTPAEKISPGILYLCPNLFSMSLSWKDSHHRRPPYMNVFQSANPAPSLTELKFMIPSEKDLSPSNKLSSNDLRDKWSAFFDTFLYQSVPNLREIRVTCFEWPLTREHDISRCFWVPVAEALLALNIDLKDDEGKKWRPRLKVGGRGPA